MVRKTVIVADPGIDGAFAIALALRDPDLEVLGLAAAPGNVSADQATRNMQILVEQFDPPRWPRMGKAIPVTYDVEGSRLHGPTGLGAAEIPCAQLHHQHLSDKLLIDLVRQHPGEVTVLCLGPLTTVARAFDRDPELPGLLQRLVVVGGTWHEPGNASPVAEFHFYCDPHAARQVLQSRIPITLVPLDITRKLILSPTELDDLLAENTAACRFLRQIIPYGIRMSCNLYGIEGFHLKDVMGLIAVSLPSALTTKAYPVDVETKGELTRGMSVIDSRPHTNETANVDVAVAVDVPPIREHMRRLLSRSS